MWRRRHILVHTQRLCSGLTAAAGQGLTSGESSGADILFETLTIDLEVSLFVNVRANRMRADGLADGCSTPSTLISPTLHLPSRGLVRSTAPRSVIAAVAIHSC